MKKLIVEMLPAAEGDALFVTFGEETEPHYILIDGGRRSTYGNLRERVMEIEPDAQGIRFIDLLVVTHIDADHIEGIICLLQDEEVPCRFGDIWFNDWNHLEPLVAGERPVHLGAAQGEFLGALLHKQQRAWNEKFNGGAVVVPPEPDPLPSKTMADDLRLTLVSPTVETLIDLRKTWTKAIEDAGFRPGDRDNALAQFGSKRWTKLPKKLGDEADFKSLDHSEANGSSIAMILEYGKVRLLLAGDAHPKVLRENIERWCAAHPDTPDRIALDAFKVPHHGSKKNATPQLMEVLECGRYLISTSGSRFKHPDIDAIRIIMDGHNGSDDPNLLFNYKSRFNDFWAHQRNLSTAYEDDALLVLDIQ